MHTATAHQSVMRDLQYALTSRRSDLPTLRVRLWALAPLVLLLVIPQVSTTRPSSSGQLSTVVAGYEPLATALSLAVFLTLYTATWMAIERRWRRGAVLFAVVMALLGLVLIPYNRGGIIYVLYATAFAPYMFSWTACCVYASGMVVMMVAAAFVAPFGLTVRQHVQFAVMIVTTGVASVLNSLHRRRDVKLFLAQEEVEEMAALAERERISRDLHDLLGHTLSVIALKSELASRIADSDPQRAAEEIREVEQVSRSALSEVRAAVEGYRGLGFSGELRRAARVLESAGIHLDATVGDFRMMPRQESVIALALREALINVVRHARATRCRVALTRSDHAIVLTISDDGAGGPIQEGTGLAGMRERVTSVGGTVTVSAGPGVTVTISVPT